MPGEDDCAPTLILFWSISRLVWSSGLKVSGPNDSVPFAGAVRTDSPHVYFILRLGCLVSLSSNVINALSQDPAVARLMNSSAAPHSPPSYPSSRCQIKAGCRERKRERERDETVWMCLCVFMFVLSLLPSVDFLTTRNKRTFNLLIKNEPTTIDKNTSVAQQWVWCYNTRAVSDVDMLL